MNERRSSPFVGRPWLVRAELLLFTNRASFRVAIIPLCVGLSLQLATAQESRWKELKSQVQQLDRLGEHSKAIQVAQDVVSVAETTFGRQSPETATSLQGLAELLEGDGRFDDAETLYRQCLVIKKKVFGSASREYASALNNLGMVVYEQGHYELAEPIYGEALAVFEHALGPNDIEVAKVLNNLALLRQVRGQYTNAEPLYRRALAIKEKTLGSESPSLATSLNNLAWLYKIEMRYREAEALYKRALAIIEKTSGPRDRDVGVVLDNLASLYRVQGLYMAAEPLYKRSLRIREEALGPNHPDVAATLNNLGGMYEEEGQFGAAEALLRRAVAISERVFGTEHPNVASALHNLAALYKSFGQYGTAETLLQRTLTIREKSLGLSHPEVASTLDSLGDLYSGQGAYGRAESLYKRALAIRERAFGPNHRDVGLSLDNLAALYQAMGEYGEAEPLLLRAAKVFDQALGPDHPDVAISQNNLGTFYEAQGRYADAEMSFQRALAINIKALGSEHPVVASTRHNLAELYQRQGRYSDAARYLKSALAIREKFYGANHPDTADSLNSLAGLYQSQNRYDSAEVLFKRALSIRENAFGLEHEAVANSLNNLGGLYKDSGEFAAAENSFVRALRMQEAIFGLDYPDNSIELNNLAALYYKWGRPKEAEKAFDQALNHLNSQFERQFRYMAEKQRLIFLGTASDLFPLYFSFALTYRDEDGMSESVYDLLLWQKGLVASSVAAERARVSASDDRQSVAIFDQLTSKRQLVAALTNAAHRDPQATRMEVERAQNEADGLEKELVQRSAVFAEERKLARPTWDQVRRALQEDEAAVEYVRFPFHDGQKWTDKSYYAALVVRRNSTSPELIVLGEAKELERDPFADYRAWVQEPGPGETSRRDAGRKFSERFWQPLEGALAGAKRIYISPDGILNQVTFGVLPFATAKRPGEENGDGKLLMDVYDLRLVSSTKDLLRPAPRVFTNNALLVGNPKFDLTAAQQRAALSLIAKPGERRPEADPLTSSVAPVALKSSSQARDLLRRNNCPSLPSGNTLCPLAATQLEVEDIFNELKTHQWQVDPPYTQSRALKEIVKNTRHPRLLHIATHGFFPPEQKSTPNDDVVHDRPVSDDPMLRSGLFFAGAERALKGETPAAGVDDGVLTAYEASMLDLHGTELVVLSACGTGLGKIEAGEGVFGLRRALQEAGAQSVLMSVWSVPDTETRELMKLFYQNWLGGKDKPTALREAQQRMRTVVKTRYGQDLPYYWGGFLLVGQ